MTSDEQQRASEEARGFVTALPRPYIGASVLLVLLACLIPAYMGAPASIGSSVADAVDKLLDMSA